MSEISLQRRFHTKLPRGEDTAAFYGTYCISAFSGLFLQGYWGPELEREGTGDAQRLWMRAEALKATHLFLVPQKREGEKTQVGFNYTMLHSNERSLQLARRAPRCTAGHASSTAPSGRGCRSHLTDPRSRLWDHPVRATPRPASRPGSSPQATRGRLPAGAAPPPAGQYGGGGGVRGAVSRCPLRASLLGAAATADPPPASRPAALLCPARRRWGRRARRAVSECVAHVGVPVRPGASGKMLLSLVLHTYSMRYFLPAAVMMGTAPTYVLAWGAWRLLSAVLPARFYREVDDRLYTIYQSMVLFFFENYAGVQVSRWRGAGLPHGGRWGAAGGSAEPAPFPGRPRASPAPGAAPAVGRKRAAAVCRCGLRPFPAHTALWGQRLWALQEESYLCPVPPRVMLFRVPVIRSFCRLGAEGTWHQSCAVSARVAACLHAWTTRPALLCAPTVLRW